MTTGIKFAALLVAMVVGAAAQQSSDPPGTSSSKPKTGQQASPSTSKPAPPRTNAPNGTTAPKPKVPGAARPSLSANWKRFCAPEGDYCVKYPTTWEPIGDSVDSGGLVIAPVQPNKPSADWNSVTIAATDLPQPPAGKERPTFDELIGVVLESMRPGVNQQTLERRQMDVDKLPAQILKLKYVDEGKTWIEEIVLIDGEDVVYSMALRCTPEDAPSYEPIFKEIVGTWREVEGEQ